MGKKWKMRGGIVLLLVGFILSIGSVSWAGSGHYGSQPQIRKKQVQSQQGRKEWMQGQPKERFNLNLAPEQRKRLTRLKEKWIQRQRGKIFSLAPEQRMELTQLNLFFQEQTVDLRGELIKRKIELQRLWLKRIPDRARMYSLIDEISEIKAQINKKTVDYILRVKEILTPEQLKKLFFLKKLRRRAMYPPAPDLNR